MKQKKQIDRRQFVKNVAVSATALSIPMILSDKVFGTINSPGVKTGLAGEFHKTSKAVNYKCLFNHELLIVIHEKENSPKYIQSFVKKLENTDVDVVMCCPTAWRGNLYPSEVDPTWKNYSFDEQRNSKFPSYGYIMKYIQSGGDPVKDTFEACRKYGKDFFISYRMNDGHHLNDPDWPTHSDFWRDHPKYWFGDNNKPFSSGDDSRMFNYMHQEVRDWYFSILEELCKNYDVDGVELDFQRHPKFFRTDEVEKGTEIMTSFVRRIKQMMDKIGTERGKSLKLCVRVPHTLDKCSQIGLDVPAWDRAGLVDMINVSSSYIHTMEIGIEEFKDQTKHAKIYGEMHFVTDQIKSSTGMNARRFTTVETYRGTAFNFLYRGADGISLFNFDYVVDPNGWEDKPKRLSKAYVPEKMRETMADELKKITNLEYLKTVSKDYVINGRFESLKETDENTVHLIIPDDTEKVKFDRAILRVETKAPCANLEIGAWLNGTRLDQYRHKNTELFKPVAVNEAYPSREAVKFYAVPLEKIIGGKNEIIIKKMDESSVPCEFNSLEIALYR